MSWSVSFANGRLLSWAGGKIAVTFSADRFDEYPDTLHPLATSPP